MMHRLRFPLWALLLAMLALTGCQSAPPKGLTAEQIAVLKREGFAPTDEGWAFDLSGKVLFGSDLDGLNSQSQAIVERIGKALLGVGIQGVRVAGMPTIVAARGLTASPATAPTPAAPGSVLAAR